MFLSEWESAGLWGLVAGSALFFGAVAGWFAPIPQRLVAGIMAFGAGVLISALCFDLVEQAYASGGILATASGVLAGAILYSLFNWKLCRRGAVHRKRSGDLQPTEEEHAGSGQALAMGALLDGIPESIAIGVSMLHGGAVSAVMVVAVFLSNVPEGLASAAGMRHAGRSVLYCLGLWLGIALISGVAAIAGYAVFDSFPEFITATILALAAGAMLAMIADTMLPEAFAGTHAFSGLIMVFGFLIAYAMDKLAS